MNGAESGQPAEGLRFVDSPRELVAVMDPGTDVVVWLRPVDADLSRDAARLLSRPGGDFVLRSGDGEDALGALASRLPEAPALAQDMGEWLELFRELAGASSVGLRVAALDRPMCPRYHVDHVTVRMVITYAGPGTEFVSRAEVDASRLGHRAGGAPDETSGLFRVGTRVHRAAPADVVLLKGAAWPGNEARGAIHRSPGVPAGCRRLVATFDALD